MYSKAMILSKKNNVEPTLRKAAFDPETSSESRPRREHFPGIPASWYYETNAMAEERRMRSVSVFCLIKIFT